MTRELIKLASPSTFEREFRLCQASGSGRIKSRSGAARTCGADPAFQHAAHGTLYAHHRRVGDDTRRLIAATVDVLGN
jgi:hypothetical protein